MTAVLLLGCVLVLPYLVVTQISPVLTKLGANYETAGKIATALSVANPIFTIIFIVFAVNDRFTKRRAERDEWRQEAFEDLVNEIPNLANISDLTKRAFEITKALIAVNSVAVWAEAGPDQKTKEGFANRISDGMKGKYNWNLPARVEQVFEELADITVTADPEQAKLFKQRVRAKTAIGLCGWILVDACSRKNTELLQAAHTLGIDAVAIDNFKFPGSAPKEMNLETLRKMIEWLCS